MKTIDRLRQHYTEMLKFDEWSSIRRNYQNNYLTIKQFCLDCSLLSFAEIEEMENQENK